MDRRNDRFINRLEKIREPYYLRENSQKPPKRIIFYYCGHAEYGNTIEELVFVSINSKKKDLKVTGLKFEHLLEHFARWASVKDKILIIDTCYSVRSQGKNSMLTGTLGNQEAELDLHSSALKDFAVICSVSRINERAKSNHPRFPDLTLFSGELINLLWSGIPDIGDYITVGDMVREIRKAICIYGDDFPLPSYQSSSDQIILTANKLQRNDYKLGLINLYQGDVDTNFEPSLISTIEQSKDEIIFIGWGLGFIGKERRVLTECLINQLKVISSLRVYIFMTDSEHPGLKKRIEEEDKAQPGVHITPDWSNKFFDFIKKTLHSEEVDEDIKSRCFITRISYMPTATILKLDDVFFYRPYGSPNRGGWASPWLHINSTNTSSCWLEFIKNEVDFALQDAGV